MNDFLFCNECTALLNINSMLARPKNDLTKTNNEIDAKSEKAQNSVTIKSNRFSQFIALTMLTVMMLVSFAAAPVMSETGQFEDPIKDKLDFWGYQRLIKTIGMEKTRQVAGLIEYSTYPDFVRAIIAVESAWNSQARSHMDAIGLMQIRMIAAGEVDADITENKLFEPITNVEIGIQIFEEHMKYFDVFNETEHWALTSYNRGRGGTFRLKQDPPYTDYSEKVVQLSQQM